MTPEPYAEDAERSLKNILTLCSNTTLNPTEQLLLNHHIVQAIMRTRDTRKILSRLFEVRTKLGLLDNEFASLLVIKAGD